LTPGRAEVLFFSDSVGAFGGRVFRKSTGIRFVDVISTYRRILPARAVQGGNP
jgi:hypothetical protein